MNAVKAGAAYFALTFAVGFLVGPVRELVLKPKIGSTAALLVEAPVMLAAMLYLAGRIVNWLAVPPRVADRIAMGLIALALLLVAEAALSFLMRGMTPAEWLVHFASVEGGISIALYAVFALTPLALLTAVEETGR